MKQSIPLYIILAAFLLCGKAMGQNLIYNGSFELGLCEPKYGFNFSVGVNIETGWRNTDSFISECNPNDCSGSVYNNQLFDYHFNITTTDTLLRGCGRGTTSYSATTNRFSSEHVLVGRLNFDSSGFELSGRQTPFISQKLPKPLIKGHNYFYYMFYSLYHLINVNNNTGATLVNRYNVGNWSPPNTTHNGFGVAFSTYHIQFDSFQLGSDFQQILSTTEEQRKLRFTLGYKPHWQKVQDVFTADSNYTYLSMGNFWTTDECTFTPPLSGSTTSPYFLFIDSVNMWDVTHHMLPDSNYCSGQEIRIPSESFSRGYTVWYNSLGDSIGVGDTLSLLLSHDTFIRSVRHFPEIEYSTADSGWIRIQNKAPKVQLSRVGDPCSLPAYLQVLTSDTCDLFAAIEFSPSYYNYTLNGKEVFSPLSERLEGKLSIVAAQEDGCSDTVLIEIPICVVEKDNLWIPNAFSPNTDEYNKTFKPISEYIKSYDLTIYNRWGEQVFESTDQRAWDGTYLNTPAPQGVYIYRISIVLLDGTRVQEAGTVTLLR